MIATILTSAQGFPAVGYNERKVRQGTATLLEITNFGNVGKFGNPTTSELTGFLEAYSSNTRVRNPQFHLVLSCKGDEMTNEGLVEFAHEYMREMGYGEPGQPLLIYAHNDTDNNHIHVITSRVNQEGKKIDDHNERRKSQKVLAKLTGQNMKEKASKDVQTALSFNLRSEAQFKAILEAINYECYDKGDRIMIKKSGMVQESVNKKDLESIIKNSKDNFEEPNYNRLKGIFSKYRDLNSDLNGLKDDLRKKFGLGLVFFGKKDSPYGYAVVDFNNKKVYEGSKILSVKQLLNFETPEAHLARIDSFIDKCFEDNPDITTRELNRRLKRMNAFVRKGEVVFGKQRHPLKPYMIEVLSLNNKLEWIKAFSPRCKEELYLLCKLTKINPDKFTDLSFINQTDYDRNTLSTLSAILGEKDEESRNKLLSDSGYRIIRHNGRSFVYNPKDRTIIDMERAGLKIPKSDVSLQNKAHIQKGNSLSGNLPNLREGKSGGESTGGVNREWEVGTKKKWDEVDDGRQMKY